MSEGYFVRFVSRSRRVKGDITREILYICIYIFRFAREQTIFRETVRGFFAAAALPRDTTKIIAYSCVAIIARVATTNRERGRRNYVNYCVAELFFSPVMLYNGHATDSASRYDSVNTDVSIVEY